MTMRISSAADRFLDPEKASACVHCGLCLPACPTYLETGNENDSPRGRIYLMRAVDSGQIPLAGAAVRHIDLCLGCRACEAACPSGVRYGDLLESARQHIDRHYRRPRLQTLWRRWGIGGVLPYPGRIRAALWPARLVRALGLTRFLPRFARDALALLPAHWEEAHLPELSPALGAYPRGRVGLISGCVMQALFGSAHRATVRLLNEAGYDVYTPRGQVCCGALFAHEGRLELARNRARLNIAIFEPLRLDAVIINAAGCGSTLKEYGHLLAHDPAWRERAARFGARVKDLSEWLAAAGAEGMAARPAEGGVTSHDACHLAHAQGVTEAPRRLARGRAGAAFVELAEADVCCGSAGSYNLTEPGMAERLQERKIRNILRSGARTVVTTNPGCILQMQAGLRKAGADHVRVLHLAEYLAETGEPEPARAD